MAPRRRDALQAGHAAPITAVEWSPDGRWLATGAYDGSVLVWDVETSSVARVFLHPRLVNGVRWSHDARLLASASADSTCRVWDVESGRCVAVLARHTDDVVDAAWSSDDTRVVTVAQDGTGRMWTVEGGELLEAVMHHRNHCMSVDWNAASGVIATCGEDSSIRLWDEDGALVAHCAQPGDLESCRWSPDGRVLAGACDTGSVQLLEDGVVVAELGPLASAAKSVSWSPDGRFVAVGSYEPSCTVFELDTGRVAARYEGTRLWPRSIDWSPDGGHIAIGTFDAAPAIVRVDLPRRSAAAPAAVVTEADLAPEPVRVASGPPTHGFNAIAPAGEHGILLGGDDGHVWRWSPYDEPAALEIVERASGGSLVNTLDFSARRGLLAFGTFAGDVVVHGLDDGATPACVHAGSPVNQVVWSRDGERLAVATYHGIVHLVSVDGPRAVIEHSIDAHDAAVKGVAWLDSSTLVTAATDGLAKVLSTSGETVFVLAGHGNLLNAVSVSTADGAALVATVSRDRTIRIWDARSGTCVRVLSGHDESVKSVAWRPGSTRILLTGSYDFDARVWDLDADEDDDAFSTVLARHRNGVGAVAWWDGAPVTASWDATSILWPREGEPSIVSAITLAPGHSLAGAPSLVGVGDERA